MTVKRVAALLGGGQQKIDLGGGPGQLPALLKPKKELSAKGEKSFNSLKKKFDTNTLANMITNKTPDGSNKPVGEIDDPRLKKKQNRKEQAKAEIKPTAGKKIGQLDTAYNTSLSEDQQQRMMRGDGAADVVAKIINFMKRSRSQIMRKRDLLNDFREEREAKQKREQEALLRQSDAKAPGTGGASKAGATPLEKTTTPLEKVSEIGREVRPETAKRVDSTGSPVSRRSRDQAKTNEVTGIIDRVGGVLKSVATSVTAIGTTGISKVGSFLRGAPTATRVATGSTIAGAAGLTIAGETGATTKEEALKKVGQIVPNDPKPGVSSYGIFGINSGGSVQSFVKENPQFNLKSKPGSKEFDREWKLASDSDPQAMYDAQMEWYKKHVLSPVVSDLNKKIPANFANDPGVITYMADRRAQYGKVQESSALNYALNASTPEEFINKMSEYDAANIDTAFKTYLQTHGGANRKGLLNRIEKRRSYSLDVKNNTGEMLQKTSKENSEMKNMGESNQPVIISSNNILVNNRLQRNISVQQQYTGTDLPLVVAYSNAAIPLVGA